MKLVCLDLPPLGWARFICLALTSLGRALRKLSCSDLAGPGGVSTEHQVWFCWAGLELGIKTKAEYQFSGIRPCWAGRNLKKKRGGFPPPL